MRRVILLAGLALALGVLMPASARPAVGGSELPYRGSGSGSSTLDRSTGQVHVVSTGHATHFGLSVFEQQGYVIPIDPETMAYVGDWSVTAANGDQLFGTASGTLVSGDGFLHSTFQADYTSTGGTGRFADASARFTCTSYNTRVSVVGTIVNSVHQATCVGQLSW